MPTMNTMTLVVSEVNSGNFGKRVMPMKTLRKLAANPKTLRKPAPNPKTIRKLAPNPVSLREPDTNAKTQGLLAENPDTLGEPAPNMKTLQVSAMNSRTLEAPALNPGAPRTSVARVPAVGLGFGESRRVPMPCSQGSWWSRTAAGSGSWG